MSKFRNVVVVGALGCALAGAAQAQVTREDDASSIAGLLDAADPAAGDEYTFNSTGRAILFADADATLYEMTPGAGGHEEATEGEDEDGESCAASPSIVCVEVLDAAGAVLCSADRPPRPGWQRDPRLVCPLVAAGEYTLRVARCASGGHEEPSVAAEPTADGVVPYLLNVSLRAEASEGKMNRAIGQSKNQLR